MAVLPKIQGLLDQLAAIKIKLAEVGFKQKSNQYSRRTGKFN